MVWLTYEVAAFLALTAVLLIAAGYLLQIQNTIIAWSLRLPHNPLKIRVQLHVAVPMSDGVNLMADIYRPRGRGRYPAILIRTPYGKRNIEHNYPLIGTIFASQGYLVIVQDVRGKYESEGRFVPFVNEEKDGQETIRWVSEQRSCDGSVAFWGFSYLGSCAWLATPNAPPPLKAAITMFCSQNAYTSWFDAGVPYLKDILFWLSKHHGRRGRVVTHEEVDNTILQLPVLQFDKRLKEGIDTFRTWMAHLQEDEYWAAISVSHRRGTITIPSLFVGGWYDRFLNNTVRDFRKSLNSSSFPLGQSRLLIGPWGHMPSRRFPDIRFGSKAKFKKLFPTMVRWYDQWLKGVEGNFDAANPVDYFVMGSNEWHSSPSWPPPGVRTDYFYLDSGGHANGPKSDGRLVAEEPVALVTDSYVYNPQDPAPSIGNKMLYGNETDGPREQSSLLHRNDLLIYTSGAMKGDYTIAGNLAVILYASSSALDTDFFAKLSDLHPNGKSYFLLSGLVRMRFLDSVRATHGIEPNKVYRVEINLGDIAHTFLRGHSLLLQITSSDFPDHERNLNTGGSNEGDSDEVKAKQTIYHGGIYPSHLTVPHHIHRR